ncbi:MAG: hypothetical protein K6T81_16760 [Alicyclobacillus macrosporangiidus]|uniref:hypothetical protein n=1 Tax=Alicyclobacillus macrosporangiidus TaxID=392015 RepID=UPI0026ECD375|nr:hypothetical protein [Alicyclobacillus macrosporangiidus]MCL6600364.1 hypothetical protein [Alicyclobacillus macrosporangiidus]
MTIGRMGQAMVVIALTVGLASGCGAAQNGTGAANTSAPRAGATQNAQSVTNQTTASPGNDAPAAIRSGIDSMLATTAALTKAIEAKDAAQAGQLGDKLEEQWGTFEDQVRPRFPDDYEAVEKYLDPLHAGTKASSLDVKTLSSLNGSLIQALQALKQKLS